jgi:hypothetical protein
MGKKENGQEVQKAGSGPTLIKPKIKEATRDTGTRDKETQPQLTKTATKTDNKPSAVASDTSPIQPKQDPRGEKTSARKEQEKSAASPAMATSKVSNADPALIEKARDASKEPPDIDLSKIDKSFQKHDHAKYDEKIANSAKDLVRKEPGCKFARLCKNTTTDQWDLNLYFFHERTYVLATYAWDEVDEKWKEAFTSDKQPASRWREHLEISSSGKKCINLKGTLP